MKEHLDELDSSPLIEYLKALESRIQRIESKLGISIETDPNKSQIEINQNADVETEKFEFNLGEYWFAEAGVFIIAIAFAFLLVLPYENINPFIPSGIGFGIAGGLFLIARFWKTTYTHISKHLWGASFLLMYFSTFRLFHLGEPPALSNQLLETGALFAIVALCYFIMKFNTSVYLTALTLTLLSATTLILNNTWLILVINALVASLFVYYFNELKKTYFIFYGVVLCYVVHLVWALGNPFHTGSVSLNNDPSFNLLFILIYTIIFSWPYYNKEKLNTDGNILSVLSIVSALLGFFLFQLINITTSDHLYMMAYQLLFFFLYTLISILLFYKNASKLLISVFSLLAYAALSIGIIVTTELPNVYIFLIWQSLIVAGTAIWFKSKKIIVANFVIFLFIFVAYLSAVGSFGIISLSFGIVALISARLLNWQKEKLTLQTEMLRNVYLTVAFISIPFTLFKAVPHDYVGISWLAVSILYYVLSVILNNYKYRWMAHLTLLSTIIFSFVFGMSSFSPTARVATFLSIGLVLVAVSIFFTKLRVKNQVKANYN